jgi:hypothetical protein
MSNSPLDLNTMRLQAQRAKMDASETMMAMSSKSVRKDKDRMYKQITRRVQR